MNFKELKKATEPIISKIYNSFSNEEEIACLGTSIQTEIDKLKQENIIIVLNFDKTNPNSEKFANDWDCKIIDKITIRAELRTIPSIK